MKTEFNIGDEVWYGYPEPEKGKITQITISANGIFYSINGANWRTGYVAKSEKEARIKGIKSDLETHKRYIAKLEKELEELEK